MTNTNNTAKADKLAKLWQGYKTLLSEQMGKVAFITVCGMVLVTYRNMITAKLLLSQVDYGLIGGSQIGFVVALLGLWITVFHVIPALNN